MNIETILLYCFVVISSLTLIGLVSVICCLCCQAEDLETLKKNSYLDRSDINIVLRKCQNLNAFLREQKIELRNFLEGQVVQRNSVRSLPALPVDPLLEISPGTSSGSSQRSEEEDSALYWEEESILPEQEDYENPSEQQRIVTGDHIVLARTAPVVSFSTEIDRKIVKPDHQFIPFEGRGSVGGEEAATISGEDENLKKKVDDIAVNVEYCQDCICKIQSVLKRNKLN